MPLHDDPGRAPARFLVENIDLVPGGRILDIAMGDGRNAVFLAARGRDVTGIDISPEAVHTARRRARQQGVRLRAETVDLEHGFSIEKESYDGIICFNYLYRPLIPEIRKGLRRGGVVVYETYITDQARFGRPTNPVYLLKHNELLEMFRGFRCLRYREGLVAERKAVAGIVAVKPQVEET